MPHILLPEFLPASSNNTASNIGGYCICLLASFDGGNIHQGTGRAGVLHQGVNARVQGKH